jgi:hypothetical protein
LKYRFINLFSGFTGVFKRKKGLNMCGILVIYEGRKKGGLEAYKNSS